MASQLTVTSSYVSNDEILRRIEDVCLDVMKSVCSGNPPELTFPRHSSWDELSFKNVVSLNSNSSDMPFTKVRFDSGKSAKKFATMFQILKLMYKLVQENKFCTKRDVYYQYPDLYTSQSSIDRIVDDVACMLQVPRWDLHILATSKGLVAGDLMFTDEKGSQFDCSLSNAGNQIPVHTKDMQNIHTSARFVLIVEKDATFQKLIGENFCRKMGPCILVTGKGFPDNGTRLLLRQLWTLHHLPIFVLVDADPHGIEIMAVYKYGSMSQAYENQHLAIPAIHWLGILPEDILRLHIPQASLVPLTPKDVQKCKALKVRPYFMEDTATLAQVNTLLGMNAKAEIQCLDMISSTYLCDVYLPTKISPFFN